MKHIETRLSEERFVTSDPHKMLNKNAQQISRTTSPEDMDRRLY